MSNDAIDAENSASKAEVPTTLRDLPIGWSAKVVTVGGEGSLRQHFLDMGIIPNVRIEVVKYAPMGDPMQVHIHGYELTLRMADAAEISIEDAKGPAENSSEAK